MNRTARTLLLLLLVGGFIVSRASVSAQNFAIDWFTIDAGAATSSGGVYSISATIGQPDAGRLAAGSFVLDGGFWGLIAAVQAPRLSIRRTPESVIISWPDLSVFSGFELQDNPTLGASTWGTVPTVPVVVGGSKQVTILSLSGNRFYRLKRTVP